MKALIVCAVPPIPPSHATTFLPRTATVIEQTAVGGLAGLRGITGRMMPAVGGPFGVRMPPMAGAVSRPRE
ncbi:MAG TPA: hypothetical protein VF396_13065 [Bradyrhizobium sp.]